MRLAYNLYLIAHNVHEIQARLIDRLKNHQNFQGAFYETQVAADLIRAGFELEYENEADNSTTHCEFTATYGGTGRRFSVEAKSRALLSAGPRGKVLRVAKQLRGALEKKANHSRLVFIDINRPVTALKDDSSRLMDHAVRVLRRQQRVMMVGSQPAPQCYICLTNLPDQYDLTGSNYVGIAVFLGFKIPDFGEGAKFNSIRSAVRAREKHAELFAFSMSLAEHHEIPTTFDGQLPSVTFGDATTPRLVIGQRYWVPNAKGEDVQGVLVDATVDIARGEAVGVYALEHGNRTIAKCPLTPREIDDYRRHPDTFFGVFRRPAGSATTPIELYDFFFGTYKDTPKQRLLEFVKGAPDYNLLEQLDQRELAEVVCERWAYSILENNKASSG